MTNAIGINILDTAQLDPGPVCELVERFDMTEVTVMEATNKKEAWALAKEIQRRRGDKTDIFYRRWKEDLPDERMVSNTTSAEFVHYMQDVMEAGFVASVYNEAQQSPMTPLTRYSIGVMERTAPHGWRTVHFKTSTGTPIGYHGEQPDGYAESDDLWRIAVDINKPRMDRGEKPLAHVAPHAYFPSWGLQGGHTDRPAEIVRRMKQLNLDPKYLPISIGETGLQRMDAAGHIDDAHAGWKTMNISEAAYARVYSAVLVEAFVPLGATGHLFTAGDQQRANNEPGQWDPFNLLKATAFWNELELLMKDGRFQIVTSPAPPALPPYTPTPVKMMERYQLRTPGGYQRKMRYRPSATADEVGRVPDGATVLVIDEQSAGLDWWRKISYDDATSTYIGWINLDENRVQFRTLTSEIPVVKDPAPPLPVPPAKLPETPPEPVFTTTITRSELEALVYDMAHKALENILKGMLAQMV